MINVNSAPFPYANFLLTLNNQHPQGFDNALYVLAEEKQEPLDNAVVLINYSHKEYALHQTSPDIHFYEVKEKRPFVLQLHDHGKQEQAKPLKLITRTSQQEYIQRVTSLKEHIQRGDIYEINFCVEFEVQEADIDPWKLFTTLNALTEAPYAAFAKLGNTYIISGSPELFLEKKGTVLRTKPIKGTAKRSADAHEDENLKNQLHLSLKERTENVMIVDVARNDLSVIAKRASVKVPELYAIETYKTVHQMVSTVQCELKENLSFTNIVQATFPMPSMTGAPKIRAMQLIDEFEQFSRKQYSGALGYIDEKGDFKLSVLIRTIVYDAAERRLSFAVGSAITHMCDPKAEYEECLLKANALIKALNGSIE